jgi:putative ABC transport system permease protein
MIALEVAGSLILLIGASLLVRSFIRMEAADPGFRPENLLIAHIALPVTLYQQPGQRIAFERSLLDRMRALPGVLSVGAAEFMPFAGGPGMAPFQIVGHPRDRSAPSPIVVQSRTSAGYLQTMGIPLLRGRGITSKDEGSVPVAVVDETLVKMYFANLDPIGMQIQVPIPDVVCTIVGVAGGTKYIDLTGPPDPTIYYAAAQLPSGRINLAVKTAKDPLSLVNALRHEVASLDSDLPIAGAMTMEQALAESLVRQRFSVQLMAVFAAIAALLAAIGIYGVLACLVDRRRREMGIRMALGARPMDVLVLVLRQGSGPIAAGLALGIGGALGLTRLLNSLLYEVSATDPLTFTCVSSGLVAVAIVAMLIPARRATQVNPAEALRHE